MSIDKQVFVDLVGELETYYKREFTPFVKRIWYKHLSERLSSEEFVAAIEQIVVSKEFMPTPRELVEAVKGNPEGKALEEWETCVKAASKADTTVTDSLTPAGKFALRSIGGLSELGRTNEDDLRWVKKEFVSAWKAWTPDASKALPPARQDPALHQGVGFEQAYQIQALSQKISFNGNERSKS